MAAHLEVEATLAGVEAGLLLHADEVAAEGEAAAGKGGFAGCGSGPGLAGFAASGGATTVWPLGLAPIDAAFRPLYGLRGERHGYPYRPFPLGSVDVW